MNIEKNFRVSASARRPASVPDQRNGPLQIPRFLVGGSDDVSKSVLSFRQSKIGQAAQPEKSCFRAGVRFEAT